MATELAPNEGKQYIGLNAVSGRTVYCGMIFGQTVAGGTITATSTLAGLQEDTGVARVSAVLGAMNSSGIIVFPGVTMVSAAGAHANDQAWFIASAASGGVAIYVWDIGATLDMTVVGSQAIVPVLNYFFKNPGE